MFVVIKQPTFTHTVNVLVPVDGGYDTQTLKATYQVMPSIDEDTTFDLNSTAGSTAFLRATVIGLDDMVDADNKPLPYSDGLRDQLLQWPYVRSALARGYFEAISKAAVGN